MIRKNRRVAELAVSFWIGIGLMSIINVWKITDRQNALNYSWIMFFISIITIIAGLIYLAVLKKKGNR